MALAPACILRAAEAACFAQSARLSAGEATTPAFPMRMQSVYTKSTGVQGVRRRRRSAAVVTSGRLPRFAERLHLCRSANCRSEACGCSRALRAMRSLRAGATRHLFCLFSGRDSITSSVNSIENDDDHFLTQQNPTERPKRPNSPPPTKIGGKRQVFCGPPRSSKHKRQVSRNRGRPSLHPTNRRSRTGCPLRHPTPPRRPPPAPARAAASRTNRP